MLDLHHFIVLLHQRLQYSLQKLLGQMNDR
jgi:hypothetical protein